MSRYQEAWALLVQWSVAHRYLHTLTPATPEHAAWAAECAAFQSRMVALVTHAGQKPLHPVDVRIIRHSLGVRLGWARSGGYRNYFLPGGDDVKRIEELVAHGLMEWCGSPSGVEQPYARVTQAGAQAAGVPTAYNKWKRGRKQVKHG